MASSSSSLPQTWRYRVFTSFHGPDVRKTLLSHLRKQFSFNGISMFDDQGIERSQTIATALTQAIRESRISIVVLSKNYASSSWCLDELVEIFKCKEDLGQIVMTVFYGVDPSHVRKQTGDFGRVFNETCARKTEEDRQKWGQALTHAGNIAGEDFFTWDNESKMIEKIAKDVSNKLNTTISKDFEDMVGIEAHLEKMQSLLHLEYKDEAMMVGIFGPAGIGKTTIARALHSRLSSSFQLSCFMDNVSGSYDMGLDDHGLKLSLQKQLLSKILNQNGMKIYHLGAIPEWLHDQKVLIILDDVDNLEQLEALADETSWFGPGSRIIVTTKDLELLEQHGIKHTYHVDFPTKYDAREILCRNAFRQSLAPNGFEKLVERATELCDNLPLALCVIGSTLRKKKEGHWERILHRLENSLDGKIEGALRVGYDNLHKDEQLLFLLIAFFFNYQDEDYVKAMVDDCNLDVGQGLKTLAYRSLIQKSTEGKIVMHKLLQQVGREVIQRQEPWKRQILTDPDEICDVFENDSVNGRVIGISLNISTLSSDVYISPIAFKRSRNLRYLNIYKRSFGRNDRVHVLEDMNFPSRLRLLHWEEYPRKCLPPTFRPEYLVELNLKDNKLEKLWEGIQPLTNLKKMSLEHSANLKELPDFSNATNLKKLNLDYCFSLVEIPSSIGNLQKLKSLEMQFCVNLQVVPTHLYLASLESVSMCGCPQLRTILDIFTSVTELTITDTMLQKFPESIILSCRLQTLSIWNSRIDTFSILLEDESFDRIKDRLDKRASDIKDVDIEKIPDWIKDLHGLKELRIIGCPKIASLPELPDTLRRLEVYSCESLETLMPFPSPIEHLCFFNCFNLGQEARRVIITHQTRDAPIKWYYSTHCLKLSQDTQRVLTQHLRREAWLPGRNVPAEFNHRAIGKFLTIPSRTHQFRVCVVVSPKQGTKGSADFLWRLSCNGFTIEETTLFENFPKIEREHLFIYSLRLAYTLESELLMEFSTTSKDLDIIECGFQIFTDEISSKYESILEQIYQNPYLKSMLLDVRSLYLFEDQCEEIILFDEPRVKRLKT